jgi:hypothetical protein
MKDGREEDRRKSGIRGDRLLPEVAMIKPDGGSFMIDREEGRRMHRLNRLVGLVGWYYRYT